VSPYGLGVFIFWVWNAQASAPITSETHTDGGAVIRKPGSAWLEGTPAMDHRINGKRIHMQSNPRDIEQNTLEETRRMDEEHTGTIISFYLFMIIF